MFKYAFKEGIKTLVTEENERFLSENNGYVFGVQEELDVTPMEEAYKEFIDTLEPITSQYTEHEQKTFDRKLTEAKIVKAGEVSLFLNNLVKEGETVEELAEKIISNSIVFEDLYASAEVTLRNKLDKINNS